MYLSDVNVLSSHNEVGTYVIHSTTRSRLILFEYYASKVNTDVLISKGEREECILMGRVH